MKHKPTPSPLELRYVEWVDSCTLFGWQPPDLDGISVIQSVGLLVKEDEREVTLSTSKSQHGRYLDQVSIPRCAILKMEVLKTTILARG